MQIVVQEMNILWETSDEIKNFLQTAREQTLQNLQGRLNVFIIHIASLLHKNSITDTKMNTWN